MTTEADCKKLSNSSSTDVSVCWRMLPTPTIASPCSIPTKDRFMFVPPGPFRRQSHRHGLARLGCALHLPRPFLCPTESLQDGPADRAVLEIHSDSVASVRQSLTINHLAAHAVVV